jgi:hypothetical protein
VYVLLLVLVLVLVLVFSMYSVYVLCLLITFSYHMCLLIILSYVLSVLLSFHLLSATYIIQSKIHVKEVDFEAFAIEPSWTLWMRGVYDDAVGMKLLCCGGSVGGGGTHEHPLNPHHIHHIHPIHTTHPTHPIHT